MLKRILSLVLFLGLATTFAAQAQVKIGYMNSQKVMKNLPQRQKVQEKLKNFAKQQQKKYNKQATRLQKTVTKFQKQKSSLSQSEIDTTKEKISNMQASLSNLSAQLRKNFQQKRQQLINPILKKINDAIVAVAKENNLDFVLNKSSRVNGRIIYYASDNQVNITQEVINRVKSSYK